MGASMMSCVLGLTGMLVIDLMTPRGVPFMSTTVLGSMVMLLSASVNVMLVAGVSVSMLGLSVAGFSAAAILLTKFD